jgi:hypothetical protein
MGRISLFFGICALSGALAACESPAKGYCEASADCERELIPGITIPDAASNADDSVAVCTALQQGQINAYNANSEASCKKVAAKMEAYFNCVGAAYADRENGCNVLEDDCTDEKDDWQDAVDDVDGDECTSTED